MTQVSLTHNDPEHGERVSVEYPMELFRSSFNPETRLDTIAEMLNAERLGSGAGMGFRDIEWSFPDPEKAKQFALMARTILKNHNHFVHLEEFDGGEES